MMVQGIQPPAGLFFMASLERAWNWVSQPSFVNNKGACFQFWNYVRCFGNCFLSLVLGFSSEEPKPSKGEEGSIRRPWQ